MVARRGRAAVVADGGVRAGDMDVAILYDHFTPFVLMQLEEFGFCGGGGGRLRGRGAVADQHAWGAARGGVPPRHERNRGRRPPGEGHGREPDTGGRAGTRDCGDGGAYVRADTHGAHGACDAGWLGGSLCRSGGACGFGCVGSGSGRLGGGFYGACDLGGLGGILPISQPGDFHRPCDLDAVRRARSPGDFHRLCDPGDLYRSRRFGDLPSSTTPVALTASVTSRTPTAPTTLTDPVTPTPLSSDG